MKEETGNGQAVVLLDKKDKGKVFPLQVRCGPEVG